ncbi:MAG: TonB-dependent receptor [Pseudomonadota bacterium]
MSGYRAAIAVLCLQVAVTLSQPAPAREVCPPGSAVVAFVVALEGQVTAAGVGAETGGSPVALGLGAPVCGGDQISTGRSGSIELQFTASRTLVGVHNDTTILIPPAGAAGGEMPDVALIDGLMRFISAVTSAFSVRTPHQDGGIEGTEAVIAVDAGPGDTLILVTEGVVRTSARDGSAELVLEAGQASYAAPAVPLRRATPDTVPEAFRPLLLNPEGASDWAVYYPPVLLADEADDPAVAAAAARLQAGDPEGADALLATAPGTPRARAAALSIQAMAAIFRNDTAAGAALAEEAVATDPDLAGARIALSHARQAQGRIDAARDAADIATTLAPGDAYAWARLAELELTRADYRPARRAAARSLEIEETALGLAVEGFLALVAREDEVAADRFARAGTIDSTNPLPRLGEGLLAVRRGDLDPEGIDGLATAVALDPRRADLRTWLGRAYTEAGLGEKALAQYRLAAEEDPDNPNAALFESFELYLQNRPVEALTALTTAPVPGARATIRSREGLGEDRAVRSVALADLYTALGFDELALIVGGRAVDLDPASADAHRFQLDAFRGVPGLEVAQSSAQFRHTLLQPPTREPVQPSLSETDLGLVRPVGPARVSFHEFAPLFESDGFSFFGSVAGGTQSRFGDEVAFSLKEGNVSISVGQFHLETEGFRDNDEVRHDIASLVAKIAPTPDVTLTMEARIRDSEEGDRFLRAEDTTEIDLSETEETGLLRFGAHWRAMPQLDLLGAVTFSTTDFSTAGSGPDVTSNFLTAAEETSVDLEGQAIAKFSLLDSVDGHLTLGARGTRVRGDQLLTFDFFPGIFDTPADREVDQASVYAYATLNPAPWAQLTLGLSYDSADSSLVNEPSFISPTDRIVQRDQINPKLGLRLTPLPNLQLRAALTRTLKQTFTADQTLEPVTVAGFPQFFDDFDQTDAWMTAVGVDYRLLDNVWAGFEYVRRDLDIPTAVILPDGTSGIDDVDGEDRTIRGFVNATLGRRVALSAGFERIRGTSEVSGVPPELRTWLVPVSASWFHPSGFFVFGEAVGFDQDGEEGFGAPAIASVSETGVVLNAAVGYRLPRSRGQISLEVNNLLDRDFDFQNPLLNSARPTTRPLAEELSVIGRVTLTF